MARLDRVVVVGASLAGVRAAESLRTAGYEGSLTMIGAEPHLPYDRPPLSKQLLAGEWDVERVALRPPGHYSQVGIELRLACVATGLDVARHVITLDDGSSIKYDGVVVATGARPRRLPGQSDIEGVLTLRTLDDSLRLARRLRPGARLVVVGAGFIGLEVAAIARTAGIDVTVVDTAPLPLSTTLGDVAGLACLALHSQHGVQFHLGTGVHRIVEESGRLVGVELIDGTSLPADAVVVGIGAVPRTEWLATSALCLDDGVVCDERGFAAEDVVAAGDVARWLHPDLGRTIRTEHWTSANEQGAHAAASLLAGREHASAYAPLPYVWSDQYDTRIQLAGHAEPGTTQTIIEGDPGQGRFLAGYGSEPYRAVLGFGMPGPFLRRRRELNLSAPSPVPTRP